MWLLSFSILPNIFRILAILFQKLAKTGGLEWLSHYNCMNPTLRVSQCGFEDWEPEETDWFSDVPDDDGEDVAAEWDTDTVKDLEDASGETLVTTDSSKPTHCVDLYDSGCTNHISPFHDQFENYADILPKRFRAANQQTFDVIGQGELIVDA